MRIIDELSLEIARRLNISAHQAREIAVEACGLALPGYRFVPLPDAPPEISETTAVDGARAFLAALTPWPPSPGGRGIVICAGGVRLFRCAWVSLRMLRNTGCNMPVELWYLGREELTLEMECLLAPFGVRAIDATDVRRMHPVRTLRGWELKAFALLHSSFDQVLLLDADNVPLVDPEFLFDTPAFLATGAIFWPDEQPAGSRIHDIFGVPSGTDRAFESGQILLDRPRAWQPLNLAMHFCEHSDFYFRYFHGDTGTFHLAWKFLKREYSMTSYPMRRLAGVMCQHDFQGNRIFQHRHGPKWDDPSHRVPGFEREEDCLEYLRHLEELWHPAAS